MESKQSAKRILVKDIYTWQRILDDISACDGFVFRGQSNSSWELKSSSERTESIKHWSDNADQFEKDFYLQEIENLGTFKETFPARFKGRQAPKSTVGWLALMQHYGLQTRFVDFTRNINVAMYMCSSIVPHNRNGLSVWAINLRSSLVQQSRISSDLTDNIKFDSVFRTWETVNECESRVAVIDRLSPEDCSANHRIVNQDGLFLAPMRISTNRGGLTERLLGGSYVDALLRHRYFDYSGLPEEMSYHEIRWAIQEMAILEFVFPLGLRLLLRDMAHASGIEEDVLFPDRALIDTKELILQINFKGFEKEHKFKLW